MLTDTAACAQCKCKKLDLSNIAKPVTARLTLRHYCSTTEHSGCVMENNIAW